MCDYYHKYNDPATLSLELKQGKNKAFEYLFKSRYKNLCHVADTFLNDIEEAEDAVQELFSRIWQKSNTIKSDKTIDNYLFIALKNICFTKLRSKKKILGIDSLNKNCLYYEDKRFDYKESMYLWQEVEKLPEQCKIIFKLVVIEDMKYKEVAELLDISINTIKTHLRIAFKTLRKKLSFLSSVQFFFLFRKKIFSVIL